jgi:hypothetical protein
MTGACDECLRRALLLERLARLVEEARILDRDHGLASNNIQQAAPLFCKIIGVRVGKKHRAINVESAP